MKTARILSLAFTLLLVISAKDLFALDSKLVLTIDPNVNDKWYKTHSETVPLFTSAGKIARKQYFSVLVFFSGYKADKENNVKITYNIEILTPDNRSYFKQESIRAYDAKVQSDKWILMSEDYMRVCFEPEDKIGDYTVLIKATDSINKTTSESKAVITLAEQEKQTFFHSREQVSEWIDTYYKSPSPEKAVNAFVFCVKNSLFTRNSMAPLYSFFITVFSNNSYLMPSLIDEFNASDRRCRMYMLFLFAHLKYNFDSLIKSLPDEEKDIYTSALENRLPDPYSSITDASQLDMLWAIFLASGSYEPVKKIVQTLDYKDSKKNDKLKFIIYGAAEWSLKSNCSQHELVRDYCRYMLQKEQLSQTVRSELTEILKKQ